MAASISGLASGLDSATIITQLMQLEAAPQTRLESRVTTEQSVVTALQSLNTKVALLRSKSEALAKEAAWSPVTATSSHASISVKTGAGAGPTNLSVTVTSVAQTHRVGFNDAAALTDVVTGGSTTVRLDRFDGSPVELDTGDGTLAGLVAAINDPENATGLRASAVKVADGSYRLLVESVATGAAQDFELTAQNGDPLLGGGTVRAGTDAAIDLGSGITASSSSNTFTDLVPGISITLAATTTIGTTSSVSVARDTTSLAASVQGLVSDLNALLTDIDTQSAYNATTKKAGTLTGDATVRSLRSALLDAVYPGDGSSMAGLGIQVTREGKVQFDQTAFSQAYAADPVGVAERFTTSGNGFADRVAKVAKGASDATEGTLTSAITGRRAGITRLQDSIEDWDRRLELRRTTLERQFTALETALSTMSNQSSWLTGQLASLPSNNQ
ncbi:flagellar filament capping protein FliD [Nocardioides sp. R-C-SC26]|uniref:flagellar filament capping protein FliD n=1 Tax=Nocardioides sp. R-C-SC26 TaxID=2870414 RepID=UPI001E47F148|nr:flagellar filament capping protein FliD [Nocardioides sp. R-C-SC26]